MLGIQITGTFAFFNVLYAVMLLPLLNPIENYFFDTLGIYSIVVLWLTAMSLLFVGGSTWIDEAWLYWPRVEDRMPSVLLMCMRVLSKLGISSYGVFPPHPFPSCRVVPVLEASLDGEAWDTYRGRWQVSMSTSESAWCGILHHPRVEFLSFYMIVPMIRCPMHFRANPFLAAPANGILYGQMRVVLSPSSEARSRVIASIFESDPFQGETPRFARVRLYAFFPREVNEMRVTNMYWAKAQLYEVIAATTRERIEETPRYADPVHFEFEQRTWLKRCMKLKPGDQVSEISQEFWRFAEKYAGMWDELDGRWHERAEIVHRRFHSEFPFAAQRRVLLWQLDYLRSSLVLRLQSHKKLTCKVLYSRLSFIAYALIAQGPRAVRTAFEFPKRIVKDPSLAMWIEFDAGMRWLVFDWLDWMKVSASAQRQLVYLRIAQTPLEHWLSTTFPVQKREEVYHYGLHKNGLVSLNFC